MSPGTPRAPRRGHLREVRDGSSPTVPELLATDALLDRLGRHEATDGDLHDAVARILDTFALHADPETAGVAPLLLPALDGVLTAPAPAPERGPRVLTARRRTLERIGRGGVAAAAILALMGGTAAAAATGGGNVLQPAGPGGSVSASAAAGLPHWVPDAVFEVFGGSTEQRAQNTIAQAQRLAASGDPEDVAKARAAVVQVADDLKSADVPQEVVASALAAVAIIDSSVDGVAVQAPGVTPGSLLATVVSAARSLATPDPTPTWRAPQVTPTTTSPTSDAPVVTPTPTGTPTSAPTPTPTPTRATTDPVTPPSSGPAPTSPPPTSPAPTSPSPSTGTGSVPTTPVPGPSTPTDPPTGSPSEPTTPTVVVPVPTAPVTTEPVAPTATDVGTGTTPVTLPVVTTGPGAVLEPVVEPSPEAGASPSPTEEVPVVSTTSTDSSATDGTATDGTATDGPEPVLGASATS